MIRTGLQKKMLELLAELDGLLRANNIQYMLYCGSQLGADRHKGIIPWDDDVDIMMSLENYDKFIELAKTKLPEGRVVNAMELSEDYPLCYARYVDATTTALQKHTVFGGVDPGVKVDVFFCVPTSSNPKKAFQHQMEILAFNELMIDNTVMIYRRPEEFFPVYEKEKKLFDKLGRLEYMRKRLPDLKYRYDSRLIKPKQYLFFSGMAGNSHFFDAGEITNAYEVDFDGYKIMAAKNGEYYDIESYGESWYQIPENVSKPHHVWAVDLNTPYTQHLDKLGSYFDLDEILLALRARKQLKLEEQIRFKGAIITASEIKNLAVGMSVEKKYSELKDPDLSCLETVFAPYYDRQLHKENKWYSLKVPVSDTVFTAALFTLARMGEFARVMDMLKVAGEKKTASFDELQRHIEISRKLIYAIYVYPDTLEDTYNSIVAGNLYETAKGNLSLYEAEGRLILSRMKAASGQDKVNLANSIIDFVNKHMREFGNRTELLILKAHALKALEMQDQPSVNECSRDIYEDVLKRAYNGFIIQEVLDEGFDLPEHTEKHSKGFTSGGTCPGNEIIHYYVTKERFESLKGELEAKAAKNSCLKMEIKGSGDKQRIILYDKRYLSSSVLSVIQKKIDTMAYRNIWHISPDENEKVERRKMMVFADNISPEEFLIRAESDGILNEKKAASYMEYRDWTKNTLDKVETVLDKYNRDFLEYMDKVNGDTKDII